MEMDAPGSLNVMSWGIVFRFLGLQFDAFFEVFRTDDNQRTVGWKRDIGPVASVFLVTEYGIIATI